MKVIRLRIEGDDSQEAAQHVLLLLRHLADLLTRSEGRSYAVYWDGGGLFVTLFDGELGRQPLYVASALTAPGQLDWSCPEQWWRGVSLFYAL